MLGDVMRRTGPQELLSLGNREEECGAEPVRTWVLESHIPWELVKGGDASPRWVWGDSGK